MIDPYGLLPSLLQWLVNGIAGFGDTLSFGATDHIRDMMGTNGVVNKCLTSYSNGEWTAIAYGIAMGGAVGGEFAAASEARVVASESQVVAAEGRSIAEGVAKGADDIFKAGRTPKASELKKYAEGQGWKPTQTEGGPLKYVDENGTPRVTIKQGSSRAPGSGNPHVELKDATGLRIDPAGNPETRKSPGNHTPIDYDL